MDYEKAYKEALAHARQAYGTGAYDDQTLEAIFPELRESEDERIRRTLAEYFGPEAQLDLVRGVPIQKIRDWLEKQKENPKSADSISADCASDAKYGDRWQKEGDSLPDNPREVLCKDAAGNFFIGRYYTGEGWEISNYDNEDKPHDLNPPVVKWIDFPSEKQKDNKFAPRVLPCSAAWFEDGEEKQKEQRPEVKDPFDDEQFRRGYEAGKHDAMREQEQQEVDLEEALNSLDDTYFDLGGIAVIGATYYLTVEDLKDIARHFYELGKNSK